MKNTQNNNRFRQALTLPTLCNINPRSLYNKKTEFCTFLDQESIDIAFISETWEKEGETLKDILEIENYEIVANVSQRTGRGGRPAIVINKDKYIVKDLTNKTIHVPWGVEAVWALITPKNITRDSKIQKIVCCAIYYRPGVNHKDILFDHISDAYNVLSTKYARGLHFIFAGDLNRLKIDPLLDLNPKFTQIVTDYTRLSPPAILDPIIMTLSHLYQTPVCLDPLDADNPSKGTASDHRIPVAKPINVLENKCTRTGRTVTFRPLTKAGFEKFQSWIIDENWSEIYTTESADQKASKLQEMLYSKVELFFPEKSYKLNSDDQPWITYQLKKLDRKRKRIYRKERRSKYWKKIDSEFREEVKSAKQKFYRDSIQDLKSKKPGQWFQCLKKLSSYDQVKNEVPQCEEISHLPDEQQVELIAERFASIQNEYEAINPEKIDIPEFTRDQIPQFRPSQVWFALSRIGTNKSTVPGDIPAKILRRFAAYIAEPLTDVFNTALLKGHYPSIFKIEVCTPVPKVHPTEKLAQLRNISGLINFDKVFEKLIAQLIISDMEAKLDRAQFGNQRGIGIQHYLVQLLHRILTELDSSSQGNAKAVLATFVDWENAFPRQCPTLGVQSFLENGVRASLIPLLISYFEDRKMSVKWHGKRSALKHIKGGGPQGATLGLLEYLSQSNSNADCVKVEDRFKFIDDLSILEIINLLTVGLASHNLKGQVPSDIPTHNQIIPPESLQSQKWLETIEKWTEDKKMVINSKKTKAMIFNFSDKQFSTRLKLGNENIEIIENTKLLGTLIDNNLKWDLNTKDLVKRANMRMQLLRKVASFGASKEDLKEIYVLFIRSILEQSAVVWSSSLTIQNKKDLERIQKSALRIILGHEYKDYNSALHRLNLQTLEERREFLCLNFAKKCTKNEKLKHMFPIKERKHNMKIRNKEKYKVQRAKTERLKKSAIIEMQKLLNTEEARRKRNCK